MSRRAAAFVAALFVSAAGTAKEAPPAATAAQAIAQAREVYGPPDTRSAAACPQRQTDAEIVVCAELEEQSQFRVDSSGDLDPAGAGARGGVPRAPDVGHRYPPGQVSISGCFIPPCPPPMPKIIDLKAIPEAPPGSDADRVGRGLAPTGRDDRPVEPPDLPAAPAARSEDEPVTPPG